MQPQLVVAEAGVADGELKTDTRCGGSNRVLRVQPPGHVVRDGDIAGDKRMTTREKLDYRDRAELDENLDYRDENTEGREEHRTEHPNSSYQAANQHMVKFNDELKVINEQTSLDFEFRKNPAEYDLAERSLTPVLVDGLDPVSVVSTVLYRIVGVGGRRRSRVSHQFTELAPGIVHADAPQDLVRMIRLRDEEGNATTYLSNLIDRSRRAV